MGTYLAGSFRPRVNREKKGKKMTTLTFFSKIFLVPTLLVEGLMTAVQNYILWHQSGPLAIHLGKVMLRRRFSKMSLFFDIFLEMSYFLFFLSFFSSFQFTHPC